jgi:hypothetical protein
VNRVLLFGWMKAFLFKAPEILWQAAKRRRAADN